MITFSLHPELQVVKDFNLEFVQSPQQAFRGLGVVVQSTTRPMLTALQEQPGPVKYPIRWKSERQRRAYFATDGFGHGIPYRRTGQIAAGWKTTYSSTPMAGDVIVSNPAPAAGFVYGPDQQPFHKDTGWPLAEPIFNRAVKPLETAMMSKWFTLMGFEGL